MVKVAKRDAQSKVLQQGVNMGLFNFGHPVMDPTQWAASTISRVVERNGWAENTIRSDYRRLCEKIFVSYS